ncbi:MAG: DUF1127 domain-containing protein [Pseudomonadota bacterium]|nr:DUF1127 domain-containing protein [Pseudomonadota bacterium]
MTTPSLARAALPTFLAAPLLDAACRLSQSLATWNRRRRDRHRVHALDDRLLRDIGLTRSDVTHACGGARSPQSWRAL